MDGGAVGEATGDVEGASEHIPQNPWQTSVYMT